MKQSTAMTRRTLHPECRRPGRHRPCRSPFELGGTVVTGRQAARPERAASTSASSAAAAWAAPTSTPAPSQPDVVVTGRLRCLGGPRATRSPSSSRTPAKATRDFREMLQQKDLDAVIIATPPHWHTLHGDRRLRGGQGHLPAEADDAAPGREPGRAQRGQEAQPHQPGRHPDPRQRELPAGGRVHPLGQPRARSARCARST